MKEQEFHFQSFQDGLPIAGTVICPKQPIGVLQVVHGMCEHHQRYLPLMREMAKQGWICVSHDHRGHGESVLRPDDLGYFYDSTGTYVMEDVHQLTYLMKQRFPHLPYVLFGHSMGSLIARAYCKKYDYELDGLIICGSPSKNPLALAGQALVWGMAKCKGETYRSSMIQNMAFGSFIRKFAHEGSDNAWVCSDPLVVAAYDRDPHCGFTFTLNGFSALFHLMRNVYDPDDWIRLNKQLPILFIAGREDPCIGSETKFLHAVNFMRNLGYRNVRSILYPDMRHEILNEQNKEVVYADIASFLETRIPIVPKKEKVLVND